MIETRVHATFLYPGSFLPEEGRSFRLKLDADFTAQVLALSPDENWFAAEVVVQPFKRWTDGDGNEIWRPDGKPDRKYRIYIGHTFTRADIEAHSEDNRYCILLSNIDGNGWTTTVRTRRGNWQPFQDNDVCVPPEQAP